MGFSIAARLFNQIYENKLNATRSKCSKSHKIKLHILSILWSKTATQSSDFLKEDLNLCSKDEQKSYRFGKTWGWV